jgi:hypothetical protein
VAFIASLGLLHPQIRFLEAVLFQGGRSVCRLTICTYWGPGDDLVEAERPRYNLSCLFVKPLMAFYFFLWTADSIEHISQHGVSQGEFEEVVMNPEGETIRRSSGNPIAFGMTASGRILCCVFRRIDSEIVQPITAFELEE